MTDGAPPVPDEAPTAPPDPEVAAAPPPAAPAEDWESRFKYLLADFENFRRRTQRDREVSERTGRARILRELLPLYEALDRADDATRKLPEKDPLRAGLELVRKEWEAFLRAEEVRPVARVGEPFHPDRHEAVAETAATAKLKPGAVAEIVQQGYDSSVGLLRPAKVVVARADLGSTERKSAPTDPTRVDPGIA